MEVHAKIDVPHAFVATSTDISRLWEAFEASEMTVSAKVSCTDQMVRHFDSKLALESYDNPQRAAIVSIEISGSGREPYRTGNVSLGERYSAPISISLRGEEEFVSTLRTTITDTVDGMRPWYSSIATADLFYVLFPAFMLAALALIAMLPSPQPSPPTSVARGLMTGIIGFAIGGLVVGGIWTMSMLRKRYFPKATFGIGQGVTRHKHQENVRWAVIVGFVVSVGASLFAAAVMSV